MIKKLVLFIFFLVISLGFAYALPDPTQDSRVQKVYNYFNGQLLWIKNGNWTSCGQALLEAVSRVEEEGLWDSDYAPFVKILQRANLNTFEGQKKADELLTLATLNYISDMKGERLNPRSITRHIYVTAVSIDGAEFLKDALSHSDQCSWIDELAPSSPEYQDLKQLLALYRQKKAMGGWPQLPKGTSLQKGSKGRLVVTLRAQLIAQEVLPAKGRGRDVFDKSLQEAVKNYQALHGLDRDGKVRGATLEALNTPVDQRIRSIIVSLEKHRWLANPLPSHYIQVNIPGFYLKAVEEGDVAFHMPIITGKGRTKTPVFNARMTEVIFNPSWHVPPSIMRELLPKIRSNPGAFASRGYRIRNGSSGVRVIQSPGSRNALGKIRFTIDSPFAIYLHGTPQTSLFKKTKRSLSHGCIRVENPHKLAEFALQNKEKWPLKRIKTATSGTTTKRIKLEHPLPVYVTYFTVFKGESHKMHFVADAYGQDKEIWLALEKAKRNLYFP